MKKIIISAALFLVGCSGAKPSDTPQEIPPVSSMEQSDIEIEKVSIFAKAEELKDFYGYRHSELVEKLHSDFPESSVELIKREVAPLFPELMIGETIPCHGQYSAYFSRKDLLGDSLEVATSLDKSTDKLSIKINEDSTIDFITATAVEMGSVSPEKWNILVNNEYALIAQDIWSEKVVSTLTISKETGLGLWQKSNASGMPMTYEVPTGLMVYLQCFLPPLE